VTWATSDNPLGDNYDELSLYVGDLARAAHDAVMTAREAEMRRMLSAWVSELEPCAVYQSDNSIMCERLVGLTFDGVHLVEGMPPIVVAAAPGTP
jgi:hypothetical protein